MRVDLSYDGLSSAVSRLVSSGLDIPGEAVLIVAAPLASGLLVTAAVAAGTAVVRSRKRRRAAIADAMIGEALATEVAARILRHLRRLRKDIRAVHLGLTRRRRLFGAAWPRVDVAVEVGAEVGGEDAIEDQPMIERLTDADSGDLGVAALESTFGDPGRAARMLARRGGKMSCRLSFDDLARMASREEVPIPRRTFDGAALLHPTDPVPPSALLTEEDVRRRSA